ncbi:hypothetical protein [Sneathia sanguinegens]|nr:hypothetical protein [Sneathia sanguinegens]
MNIFQSIVTIFYKFIENYLSIEKKELVVDIKKYAKFYCGKR